MKIEIWSDVVCPWCYIGKRRFEEALSKFEHKDEVEVVWRSYQLDPSTPTKSGQSVTEMLASKYGVSRRQAEAMNDRVTAIAKEVGLDYHMDSAKHSNTFDAHRLIHLGKKHGIQDAVKERLMKAYFVDGEAVGEVDTLVKLAFEVGIDPEEAREALKSNEFADEVLADEKRARMFGITGVPFFAIDEKFAISGAQPSEVFTEALEAAWTDSHPLMAVGNLQGGQTFEGEACAI
jgi:predicted DsbA family dithiol-disulfide isomerase